MMISSAYVLKRQRYRKMHWTNIEGTIVSFSKMSGSGWSKLTISYSVDGQDYQIKKQFPGIDYIQGEKIKLIYDPNRPEDSAHEANPYSLLPYVGLFFGIPLFIFPAPSILMVVVPDAVFLFDLVWLGIWGLGSVFFFYAVFILPFQTFFEKYSKAKDSAEWPVVNGTIIHSEMSKGWVSPKASRSFPPFYSAIIKYSYKIDGFNFESKRITLESYYNSAGLFGRNKIKKWVEDYPGGKIVNVYYDPQNHEDAVLEPGPYKGIYGGLISGLAFLIIVLIFIYFILFVPTTIT